MKPDLKTLAAVFALVGCVSCSSTASDGASASIENSCINPTEITSQKIVSDQEIQFELRNGETWVNKLPRTCSGLKFAGGFSWEVRGTMVCSNQERITVKDTGIPCQLGEFSRVPAAA